MHAQTFETSRENAKVKDKMLNCFLYANALSAAVAQIVFGLFLHQAYYNVSDIVERRYTIYTLNILRIGPF